MKVDWQNKTSSLKNISDDRIQKFLFHEKSMTQLIQDSCFGKFNVELISESWEHALDDETTFLSLPQDESTFIRKSLLKCDDKVLIFARTVIPEKTLSGKNQKLTSMGDKPLGNFLFNDKTTYRSDMRYAKIPVNCKLYSEATKDMKITSELWGRQSLVYIEQRPLTITEIFLPAILECNKT